MNLGENTVIYSGKLYSHSKQIEVNYKYYY